MSNEVARVWTCPLCGGFPECTTPDCRGIPDPGEPDGPSVFVGKLGPNHYCRHWNKRRNKYCKAVAGAGTAHKGEGRCRKAGGGFTARTTGARVGDRSNPKNIRYANIQHERIGALIERFNADPDPYSVRAELDMARALLTDFVERYAEMSDALIAWYHSWSAAGRPLDSDKIENFRWVLDELEALRVDVTLEPNDDDYEDSKIWAARIQRARDTLDIMAKPNEGRPRKIFDIADARHLIDTIVSTVDSIKRQDEATHIARRDFFRVMGEMGNGVDLTITPERLRLLVARGVDFEEIADTLKQEVKKTWLDIRLPA